MVSRKHFFFMVFFFMFFSIGLLYEQSETVLKELDQAIAASTSVGVFEGDQAKNFQLQNQDGEVVSLDQFKGKTVIVNFFATWCGPCQQEMPELVSLANHLNQDEVALLGVNMTKQERNQEDVSYFLEHFDVGFEVVLDTDGEVMNDYQIIGIPTTVVIDENGVIEKRFNGIVNQKILIEETGIEIHD
ncbi:TlpA disulfide reductase family protein [Desertibacillus haloalkaliphilus]|uniref:TlpA disulfide reductase family protein n=1 Tax=Desertibacillus haloalkaliphilus TaxID=1328930 RepID=UPI001C25EEE7|nr:TlpA disulfide reductase family protein [Desertibacillus haloalkaliphilus]MBU8906923.1 TlpA family protein disulfide reductase [Desertibacillus haloalkaliphilus]